MAENPNGPKNPATSSTGGLTKLEAIEQALDALGWDTKPTQLQPYLKQRFGMEMTTDQISNRKSEVVRRATLKKKAADHPKKAATKPAAKPVGAGTAAKPTAAPRINGGAAKPAGGAAGSIALEDIQALKGLVGRVGATDLKSLIDVLSK